MANANKIDLAFQMIGRAVVLAYIKAAENNGWNPNPAFVVDGENGPVFENSTRQGDGAFPPFRIFATGSQTYLPGEFHARAVAESIVAALNEAHRAKALEV